MISSSYMITYRARHLKNRNAGLVYVFPRNLLTGLDKWKFIMENKILSSNSKSMFRIQIKILILSLLSIFMLLDK